MEQWIIQDLHRGIDGLKSRRTEWDTMRQKQRQEILKPTLNGQSEPLYSYSEFVNSE